MTLPLNSRLSALYDTNGTQKDFSFGFRVFFDPDNGGFGLEVRRQTADGYEVIPKSDYLVLPVEDNSAGVVRFNFAPSAGQQIYIAGKTPTIQQLVLTNFGRYSAESIETQFDFITAIIQEWLSALGEETRQRIAADDILNQYVVQRIDAFVQQVNQNWDDKSQEIEDYINTIMPSFTQALRDEIEAYAVAGMQDAIDQTLAESKAEIDDAVARANAAAAAAAITGKVYDTPEAGVDPVTGVQNGAYYNVRSPDDDSYLVEYQNVGGVPTPSGKSYPSGAALTEVKDAIIDPNTGKASTLKVFSPSGESQEELNGFFKLIEVSPEIFGFVGGDATQYFKNAAVFAKENNIPFVAKNPNGYLITESIDFYTDTEISKIVMPADGVFRTLAVKTQKAPTSVAVSSLAGLTEFSNKVTGFPLSAVGKYIRITSTDILTERNNAPSNTPYNKNTAFRLIDSTGAISPSLDMSFGAGTTAQVSVIPAETRIKVKIGALETAGTGLNNNSIIIERDSVDFYIDDVSGSTGFRTLLTLTGNDCNFFSPVIKDAQYTGLGYGISIGICCDTNIYSMKGSNCRTTLDGRHGANVTVHNSRLETAGTHWGNNYIFKDCDIDTVTWAGKDLSVMGGSLRNFISMRADVAMCIGKLRLGGGLVAHSTSTLIVPSANIIAGFFTSPRRLFDSVCVDDISCTDNILGIYAHGAIAVFAADWKAPTDCYFNNIDAPKSNQLNLCYLNLTNATALTAEGRIRVGNIKAKVVKPFMARGFSKYPSSYGYDVRAVDCGKSFIQCDANAFSRFKLVDSTLIGANRINGSVARGDMIFDDCVIEHDPSIATAGLFNVEARKGFVNVEYRGSFSNSGSVNGVTMYSIAARAAVGATGFPVPLTNHINRTLYQRDELSFSFDPPSIPANGNIRQEFDVPGAQLGDSVLASFNIYNAAIEVSGSVSATNKVSVLFKNLSGAAVDLAAGSVNIKTPA